MNRITINGKEYPCRLTMGAMILFRRETGKEVTEITDRDLSLLVTLLWCCIRSASRADKVSFDMTLEDFADATDAEQLNEFYEKMDAGKKKAAQGNPKR